MPARDADLIPVVQKSYDLCAGLYTHVNRFPRAQRSLLGRVILEDALAMLVSLTVANRRTEKAETLREASLDPQAARASVASWFGLAKHADAFRLSRSIFAKRDVDHMGKRLLVQSLSRKESQGAHRGAGLVGCGDALPSSSGQRTR